MPEHESIELIARWQSGEQTAADEIFHRYSSRLINLVRGHLSSKLTSRFDAEDVVQSAYRSFFVGARDGRFLLENSGDLWRLLVGIAMHKMQHQVERHTAGKRNVDREANLQPEGAAPAIPAMFPGREATPSEALVLADVVENIVGQLTALESRMFELRLEGYTLDEIAIDTKRSQRTVRRVMDRIKQYVNRRGEENSAS